MLKHWEAGNGPGDDAKNLCIGMMMAVCIQDIALVDDTEWEVFGGIPSRPSNLLNPPMWSTHSATANGHCGNWQKEYTKMHRGI